MSETFTPSDGLILIGNGTDSGTWGNFTNSNWQLIESAVDGVEGIVLTTTTLTLNIPDGTVGNGRYKLIAFSGSPSATVSVSITPINIQKIYKIVNNSSQSITFSNGTGPTATVPASNSEDIYCDGNGGVNPYSSSSSSTFASITDNGNLTVAGNTSLAGLLTSNGAAGFVTTVTVNGLLTTNDGITNNGAAVNLAASSSVSLPAGNLVNIASQTLAAFVQANAIPSYSAIPGSGGSFFVLYFAGSPGSRTAFMMGSGVLANGSTVAVPSGFIPGNTAFSCSLNQINTGNTSQPLCHITCSISSSGAITCTADDANSHNFTGTANWTATSVTVTY